MCFIIEKFFFAKRLKQKLNFQIYEFAAKKTSSSSSGEKNTKPKISGKIPEKKPPSFIYNLHCKFVANICLFVCVS